MIFWKLFAKLRSLEQDNTRLLERNRDLETEKTILEDRLRASLEDRAQLWGVVNESLQQERLAYHMHINLEWQKQGHAAPYPEAPHIPPGEAPKKPENPFIGRGMLGSEMVQRMTRKFINEHFRQADEQES